MIQRASTVLVCALVLVPPFARAQDAQPVLPSSSTSNAHAPNGQGTGQAKGQAPGQVPGAPAPSAQAAPSTAVVGVGAGGAQQPAALPMYAQAGPRGGRLRGLADEKGHLLCDIPAGTLLQLRGERAGWVQVEIPGGFAAWTAGQFLDETDTPGMLEFNGDRVNLRPQPLADNVNNYPIGTVSKGVRVQLIERANPERALKEDWVRVWTPPGTAAWLRKAEAEALGSGADGAKLWSEAVAKGSHLPAPVFVRPARGIEAPPTQIAKAGDATASGAPGHAQQASSAPVNVNAAGSAAGDAAASGAANSPGSGASNGARTSTAAETALATAREKLAAARTAENPELVALRQAYEQAIALDAASGKPGSVTQAAEAELETVRALETAAQMRAEMEASKTRVAKELGEKREQVLRSAAAKDPLTQAYAAHGTLVRRSSASGAPQYWLVQGSRDVCQLVCSSGRFRLELYAGRYLGIQGAAGRLASGDASIDAERIEVLRP